MIARNVTQNDMELAIVAVNNKFNGNVRFKRFDIIGRRFNFTLRVNNSKGDGARRGFCRNKDGERRALASACWHVHGHFFEALLGINPKAVIVSHVAKIDINGGNWQDSQVGSMFDPIMFSNLCECSDVLIGPALEYNYS